MVILCLANWVLLNIFPEVNVFFFLSILIGCPLLSLKGLTALFIHPMIYCWSQHQLLLSSEKMQWAWKLLMVGFYFRMFFFFHCCVTQWLIHHVENLANFQKVGAS